MWKQSYACCGCMCLYGEVRSEGVRPGGPTIYFLGLKDISNSQGPWNTSPSVPLFTLQSGEGRCPSLPTPCHYLKVRPNPQTSQETKQWFLLETEDAKPRLAHSVGV